MQLSNITITNGYTFSINLTYNDNNQEKDFIESWWKRSSIETTSFQRTPPDKIGNLAPLQPCLKPIPEESLHVLTCFAVLFLALTRIEKKMSEVILICGGACISTHCALQTFYIKHFFLSFHNRNRCILLRSLKCISMIDSHRLSSKEI